MSISVIQSAIGGAASTSLVVTLTNPTTAGSYLIVSMMGYPNGATVGVSDDKTNTYTTLRGPDNYPSDGHISQSWIATAITATQNITVTDSGGYVQAVVYEVAGITGILDTSASQIQSGTQTVVSSPAIMTTHPNELLIYVGGTPNSGGTYTNGTGWTLDQQVTGHGGQSLFAEHQIVSTTGSYTGTANTAGISNPSSTILAMIAPNTPGSKQPVVCIFM